jgi:hypothetical protein
MAKRESRGEHLNLPLPEPEQKLPFNLKAKVLSLTTGVPYSDAYQKILDQEIVENREDREQGHAP